MTDYINNNESNNSPFQTATNVVCPACGCLCDDGILRMRDERLEAEFLCPKGLAWFQFQGGTRSTALATVDGRPCSVDVALNRVEELIRRSQAPLILGMSTAGIETQRLAVELADRLSARLISASNPEVSRAVQNVGRISSTWAEIKQRAETAILWCVDPVSTHPRFLERFLPIPPRREIVLVDRRSNATTDFAAQALWIRSDRRVETIAATRAEIAGLVSDDPIAKKLATTLDQSKVGAFVYDSAELSQVEAEELFLLVRELNRPGRRVVAMDLGAPGNPAGADAVLAWQTGYPVAVDFSMGYPRPCSGERTVADLAIVIADDSRRFVGRLDSIPAVFISSEAPDHAVAAAIRTKKPCYDADETYVRADGIWLPVRAPFRSDLPTDRQILRELLQRLTAERETEVCRQ